MNPREVNPKFEPGYFDLFADGPLGMWSVGEIDPDAIRRVFTTDPDVVEKAKEIGLDATVAVPSRDEHSAEIGISIHFHRLLSRDVMGQYRRIYNFHPGFLPWGRGYYPVMWAILDGEPAGATLHEVDDGVDTGPIVSQRRVASRNDDTGYSLLRRVRLEEQNLFRELLRKLADGGLPLAVKQADGGSYHDLRAFDRIRKPSPQDEFTADSLARRIRALDHPDYEGLTLQTSSGEVEIMMRKTR